MILVEQLLLVVANDDQRVELGAAHALFQMLDRRLRFVVARGKALRRQLRQRSRVGAREQLLIGRGRALLVEKIADPVAIDKARPVLGRVLSIGVCDVAIPRTILAIPFLLARVAGVVRRDSSVSSSARARQPARESPQHSGRSPVVALVSSGRDRGARRPPRTNSREPGKITGNVGFSDRLSQECRF